MACMFSEVSDLHTPKGAKVFLRNGRVGVHVNFLYIYIYMTGTHHHQKEEERKAAPPKKERGGKHAPP